MSPRDQAIIEAVGQAYRNTGKAVPSRILSFLPEQYTYSIDHLKHDILPTLVRRGVLVKMDGRMGYKPAHQIGRYCPCCGRMI